MSIMLEERQDGAVSRRRLVEVLRTQGPQTLDCLCAMPDLGWAQVLMAVDHLTRSEQVVLEMIAPREYRVSLAGAQKR